MYLDHTPLYHGGNLHPEGHSIGTFDVEVQVFQYIEGDEEMVHLRDYIGSGVQGDKLV